MNDCVFCKIVKGELPSYKIYEDDMVLAFLTIEPISDGHLLIIPKEHIVWMQDASDDVIKDIFVVAKKLMQAIKNVYAPAYVQVAVSGEEIPHFHIHLFPRYNDDGLSRFPHKKYKEGEAEQVAKKITEAL